MAHSDLAFIKVRGDRGDELRLPATGPTSMNVGALETRTTVGFEPVGFAALTLAAVVGPRWLGSSRDRTGDSAPGPGGGSDERGQPDGRLLASEWEGTFKPFDRRRSRFGASPCRLGSSS